jgi:hypothetical protein
LAEKGTTYERTALANKPEEERMRTKREREKEREREREKREREREGIISHASFLVVVKIEEAVGKGPKLTD